MSLKIQIFLLTFMMWILGVRAQDKDCIQCATSNLMEDWGATGLPLKPANLLFDDKCVFML